jgi:hypothetical protein
MNELLLLLLLIAGAAIAVIGARVVSLDERLRALSRLEGKVDALLEHEGIRFDPYSEVPPPVLDALRRGKKIEAIKEYRAATGVGLKEAKEFVEEVERRGQGR